MMLPVDLSLVLNLVTTVAIVVGLMFGLFELRQALRSRRDLAAVDIVRTVQTQEIRRAVTRVLELPDAVDPELVRADVASALACGPEVNDRRRAIDGGHVSCGGRSAVG